VGGGTAAANAKVAAATALHAATAETGQKLLADQSQAVSVGAAAVIEAAGKVVKKTRRLLLQPVQRMRHMLR